MDPVGSHQEAHTPEANALRTLGSLRTGWIFFGAMSSLQISMINVRNRTTLVKLKDSSK